MDKRIAVTKINLPEDIIKNVMDYLYYTPEQIAKKENMKRMHYVIMNACRSFGYYYCFNYKYSSIVICFCVKCGDYVYSRDMEHCDECKCKC